MRSRRILESAVLVAVMALTGCSQGESDVEFVPFRSSDNGRWGMISPSGEVLFEEEFKEEITMVRDGRFLAKNGGGLWEIYTADHNPKKVGGEYVCASTFNGGYAFVAERNKPVSVIDTDGKTVKLLDKIEGKTVKRVYTHTSDGYYAFETQDGLFGVIDGKGKCVVKPIYIYIEGMGYGLFMGIKSKYKDNESNARVTFFDASGKELFERPIDRCKDKTFALTADRIALHADNGWGVCDLNGEWIIKPNEDLEILGKGANDDEFIYSKYGGVGVMNMKKEVVVKAKYDKLYADGRGYIAYDRKYFLLDAKGEKVNEDMYDDIAPSFDGKHHFVKSGKYISVITPDGKDVKGLPDIKDISFSDGDSYVESDYVDLQGLLDEIGITAEGMENITCNMTAQQIIEANSLSPDPATWLDKIYVEIPRCSDIADYNLTVCFPASIVLYDFNYDYDNYTNPYQWNDVRPSMFAITLTNTGKMEGKTRDFYTLLCSHFKKMGKEVKHNDNAMLLRLNNGKGALVVYEDKNVRCLWCFDDLDIDINQFTGVSDSGFDTGDVVAVDSAAPAYDYGYCDTVADLE